MKSIPATSPGSGCWPRSSAASGRWQEGWRGSQSRLPVLTIGFTGSIQWAPAVTTSTSQLLSTQPAATRWRSHESTNLKQSLVRCLPRSASQRQRSRRNRRAAGTIPPRWVSKNRMEPWPLQRRGQSHATTLPPPSAWRHIPLIRLSVGKPAPVFPVINTTFRK